MVTKSLDIDHDVLLNSIRKLGDNSKESYVIFDATNCQCILECSDSFCTLTNASRSQILNTNFFHGFLWMKKRQPLK